MSGIVGIFRYHECSAKHMDNMIPDGNFTIFLYFGMISPVMGIVSYHLEKYHLKNL
jgi:hypothetical protein